MRWRVEFTTTATRLFKKLDRGPQESIMTALADPLAELNGGIELPSVVANVTKMVGIEPPEWRLRAGELRVRFYPEHWPAEGGNSADGPAELDGVIVVFKVGHRRDVYRD